MKKILLSIFVSVIGLLSFGYCGSVTTHFLGQTITHDGSNNNIKFACTNVLPDPSSSVQTTYSVTYSFSSFSSSATAILYCSVYSQYNGSAMGYSSIGLTNKFSQNLTYTFTKNGNTKGVQYCCLEINGYGLTNLTYGDYSVTFESDNVPAPVCPSQYTSEECQQEYSLMPISSCDSEYCQLNELCGTGSSGSGDLQWSSLFINGIQHVGGSIIDVTIPSEIQRNYIYTGENEETFKLDIEGLNGDPDYIQGIIDVNSYRPTSEDFTNTFVGGLTLIFPYIIITAFIVFIWRFIRKIFK